jgi:hypothetical protein
MGEFIGNSSEQLSSSDVRDSGSANQNGLNSLDILGSDSKSSPDRRSIEDICRDLAADQHWEMMPTME